MIILKNDIPAKRFMQLCVAFILVLTSCSSSKMSAGADDDLRIITVDSGWANNSVNTTVFRKNSLVTYDGTQFISFYDKDRYVVLGKRKTGTTEWQLKRTNYQGNTADAHNSISMMVDGEGYLHLSWDHHNNALRYAKSIQPGSLELSAKMPMTGKLEDRLSYPEFYKLPNGDLLFFYRDGGSGQGNLVINKYDYKERKWQQLHSNLIDGERKRNAYWQAYVDSKGTIHISWVWRESPDVASNHDMCYARSKDGGLTWEKTTGKKYTLPITLATAECAIKIPQNSELINQTSMSADENGLPFIASYWRQSNTNIPQYHIIYNTGSKWKDIELNFRKTPFSLSGAGSKRIPIARPQILVKGKNGDASALLIFRDEERGSKVSAVIVSLTEKKSWNLVDLTKTSVGSWEPTYDTELWENSGVVNLFVQNVEQVDGEGMANVPPQKIQVLEWKPHLK
ncbi:MAG: neuraminidase [Chitinophagaceae bacterium]|nr:MAG: neuraminidase [Chitinophagaceae bacterium]